MPRIPTINAKRKISGRSGAVPISSMPDISIPADALAKLGQSITMSVEKIQQYQQLQKRKDHVNTIAEKTTQFERLLQQEQLDYLANAKGKDAYGGQDRLMEFSENIKSKLLEDIKDEEVKKELNRTIDTTITSRMDDFARHEAKQRKVVSENTRVNALETVKTNVFHGVGDLEENMEKYRAVVLAQVGTNQITEAEAENLILQGERSISERQLAGIISREPSAADELINTGLYNKYLSTKQLEHYRNVARREAENERKIKEAEQKQRLEESREAAGKELSDALLDSNPKQMKEMLGKYRDTLDAQKYKEWTNDYSKLVDNLSKNTQSTSNNETLTNLQVKALTGEGLNTETDINKFRREVGRAIRDKKIRPVDGRKIINDAQDFLDNTTQKSGIREAVQTIETLHKNDFFGEGVEGELEREKTIRTLYDWAKNNPDKPVDNFTTELFKPIKDRFWGIFPTTRDVRPSEIKERREEISSKSAQEMTSDELLDSILR